MATTTSATTSSNLSVGLKFNVAEMVDSVMASKRGPLNRIESDIKKSNLSISAIGVFRSKLELLKDTALSLQDPANFRSVSSSDAAVGTASAGVGAVSGLYSLAVKSVAKANTWEISGFTAGSTYASDLTLTYGVTPAVTIDGSGKTLEDLVGEINALNGPFTAELVTKNSAAQGGSLYSLVIRADSLGAANSFSVTGTVSSESDPLALPLTPEEIQSGQDAVFSLNGVEYTRATNIISDVANGLTFSLTGKADPDGAGAATTTITVGTVSSTTIRAGFQRFIEAYNNLRNFYDAASINAASDSVEYAEYAGSLAGNLTARTVMNQLRDQYFAGNLESGGASEISFLAMGVTFSGNLLTFDDDRWNSAIASGLLDKVASGLTLGKGVGDTNSLVGVLNSAIFSSSTNDGLIDQFIQNERYTRLPYLEAQKSRAEQSLDLLKAMYARQYSSLNVQLSKLDSMSQSIAAIIAGLKVSAS